MQYFLMNVQVSTGLNRFKHECSRLKDAQGINACFFQLRAKINQCDAQSLSNLVWAFATVLIQPGPLIKSIASASFGSLDSFAAQELLGNFGVFF